MIYKCKISCSKDSLKEVRSFVKSSLRNHGISDLDMASMVLAMDEMLANVIIHTHHCDISHIVELKIEINQPEGVFFVIYDRDKIFDLQQYEPPSLDEIVKTKRKGGMGLILVKKIMDTIEIGTESGLNYCRLFKKVELH